MLTDRSYITAPRGRGGRQPKRKTGREFFFSFFPLHASSCHDHSEYFSQLFQRQPNLSLKWGVKEWKVVLSSNTAATLPQSHNRPTRFSMLSSH